MRPAARALLVLASALIAACGSDDGPTACCQAGQPALRIINAFAAPVDVLIDGTVAIASLAAGAIGTAPAASGAHTLALRPTGAGTSVSVPITTAAGALSTVAAVRASNGAVATAVLDDTNSVVPSGATKLRVLHLAPSAGELQVSRTQPDYQQPVSWQFPFTYQAQPNSLSAPFYQSPPGSWEVRVWQSPAGASGWASATVRVVISLASGEKRTVLMLDQPGGGVRIEVL